jgi:hypothetical protein
VIYLLGLLVGKGSLWRTVADLGLITLGLALTLSPWLWRSYHLTGKFTLNDPNQMAFLTEQYHLEPQTESLQRLPGESLAAFNRRINLYLRDFILEHPGVVGGFISAHFLHNQVEMFQVLPMAPWVVSNPHSNLFPYWSQNMERLWQDCCAVQTYVKALGFWDPTPAKINTGSYFPLILNLILVSVGLATAWRRHSIIGWVPLVLSLVYSLSTAVGRYSGWRLILPADWVILMYYGVGIGQVTLGLGSFFSRHPEVAAQIYIGGRSRSTSPRLDLSRKYPLGKVTALVGLLLLAGLVPLIVEAAIPARYDPPAEPELAASLGLFSQEEIQYLRAHEAAVAIQGRGLYPRFYRSGEGEPGEDWVAYLERDYSRLGFFLVGPTKGSVILPMEGSPEWFPNAADVIIVGCQEEAYIDAAAVLVSVEGNHQSALLVRSAFDEFACPLPAP